MKITFSECAKLKTKNDVFVKTRIIRSKIDSINGGSLKIDFIWPDFRIENENEDVLTVTDSTLQEIKRLLGARYYTITS